MNKTVEVASLTTSFPIREIDEEKYNIIDTSDDIFSGLGLEVSLKDSGDFLKVVETLSRIGVASQEKHQLVQSCHILHKKGRYAIMHFKELFLLDRKGADLSVNDLARRNTIARLLEEWDLCKIINPERMEEAGYVSTNKIRVLTYAEKKDWTLLVKYTIGSNKRKF